MMRKISWLFLSTVFLTLFSCRNEQEALNEPSANRNRDIISFAAFQKETQIQKVGEVISPLSISQKSIEYDDTLSGFLIDTETINRIKANADISTYSFRIYSLFGNPQDVYNIVYRKRNDGTLHYSIIRIIGDTPYVLYDSEAASVAQKHSHKNAVAKTSNYEDCLASYSVSVWHCKNGSSWDACDKCESCLETLTVCVGSGGGDNSGGFGGQNNGNPSNPPPPVDPITEGGSAVYLTDPSGYVFDPNLPPSTDAGYVRALRAYLFWEQLPGALYRQWANEHVDIYQNIIESYLNHYSTANNTENLNFHNEAVQYFMNHPNAAWEEFYNQYLSADSPCKKTKNMLQNQEVKNKINALYDQSKLNGEKGFMVKPDGTPGALITGNETSVQLGDISGNIGYYHNHPADQPNRKGIKIHSVPDIYKLFEFIVNQPPGTPVSDSFAGMVTSMPCGSPADCPPDGYLYHNFVFTFNGTLEEAQAIKNTNYDFKALEDSYSKFEQSIRDKPEYASQYGNFMNFKGLERVFFKALEKMGIDKNKINLQRIDRSGKVYNISLDATGTPKETPCP